ncbi:MAG: putative endonuclease 4 [Syntrophomonadaceae bacterium]|nr:putative endonuclease 4 [Bacillota bacterium]
MLGSNVPTIGGFHAGFKWGDEWRCECIQIYITLSRRWNVPILSQDEIAKFKTAWQESSVKEVVAHVPYLVNLASPIQDLWNKSVSRLLTELSRAVKFGVPLLVLHPGSHGTSSRQEGIKKIIEALNKIFEEIDVPVKILLETMAGQGTMIGSCFEEIAYILEKVQKPELLGVCLDTGHLFMAGYDIKGYKGWESVLNEFSRIIGVEKIGAIHLNDSKTSLGSKSDRHACIGEGKLGLQVFHAILKDQRFSNTPKILEIPERDTRSKDNLETLRNLQNISNPLPEEKQDPTQLTLKEAI